MPICKLVWENLDKEISVTIDFQDNEIGIDIYPTVAWLTLKEFLEMIKAVSEALHQRGEA